MRHDIFQTKKSVHINLKKEVHAGLREMLFRHGITMQDMFCEAADFILSDAATAQKLIERAAKRRLREQLAGIKRNSTMRQIGELDSETLYNLLEENDRQRKADKE